VSVECKEGVAVLKWCGLSLVPPFKTHNSRTDKVGVTVMLAISLNHEVMQIGLSPPQYDASGAHH
jgi:hypothetical protein